jgi:hypothetical protein
MVVLPPGSEVTGCVSFCRVPWPSRFQSTPAKRVLFLRPVTCICCGWLVLLRTRTDWPPLGPLESACQDASVGGAAEAVGDPCWRYQVVEDAGDVADWQGVERPERVSHGPIIPHSPNSALLLVL